MVPVILDVHLVKASFCWGVFHRDRAVLVVGDMRTGSSTRRHPHFTWRTKPKTLIDMTQNPQPADTKAALTCDLSFLHSEGNDQAEGPQHRLHPVHGADGIIGGLNRSQRGGC